MMGGRAGQRVTIEVRQEHETATGWRYDVVRTQGDEASPHAVSLSWADHDHWSGGASAPSKVLEAVLGWLLDEHPEYAWPSRFDASTVRRRFAEIDEALGRRL